MREVRQEHEHPEGPEGSAGHGRSFQGRIDESRGRPKRAGFESVSGNFEATG